MGYSGKRPKYDVLLLLFLIVNDPLFQRIEMSKSRLNSLLYNKINEEIEVSKATFYKYLHIVSIEKYRLEELARKIVSALYEESKK